MSFNRSNPNSCVHRSHRVHLAVEFLEDRITPTPFGVDTRVQIPPERLSNPIDVLGIPFTEVHPGIGLIAIDRDYDGEPDVAAATAFLIGPNYALTSAHVLYSTNSSGQVVRNISSEQLTILFGWDGSKAHVGAVGVESRFIPAEWGEYDGTDTSISAAATRWDYALLKLDQNIGLDAKVWINLESDPTYSASGQSLFSAGYPADEPNPYNVPTWPDASSVIRPLYATHGPSLGVINGRLSFARADYPYTTPNVGYIPLLPGESYSAWQQRTQPYQQNTGMDFAPGQSGSPIYFIDDRPGRLHQYNAVGIHSNSGSTYGATPITESLVDNLKIWMGLSPTSAGGRGVVADPPTASETPDRAILTDIDSLYGRQDREINNHDVYQSRVRLSVGFVNRGRSDSEQLKLGFYLSQDDQIDPAEDIRLDDPRGGLYGPVPWDREGSVPGLPGNETYLAMAGFTYGDDVPPGEYYVGWLIEADADPSHDRGVFLERITVPDKRPTVEIFTGGGQVTRVGEPFPERFRGAVILPDGSVRRDIRIYFEVPEGAPTGRFADGVPGGSSRTRVNNEPADPGEFTPSFPLIAWTTPGTFTVTAEDFYGILAPATVTVTVLPGLPDSVTGVSGSLTSALPGTAYFDPLSVRVTDEYGNPVPDVAVNFSLPTSGPSGSFTGDPTAVTDANGIATAPSLTANLISGAYEVTATLAEHVGVLTKFSLTNLPNTAPRVEPPAVPPIPANATVGPFGFRVKDDEFPAGSLMVTVTSSDPSLISASGLRLSGSGENRSLTVTPVPGQFGTATVTLTVTDPGGAAIEESFVVTVEAPAPPPPATPPPMTHPPVTPLPPTVRPPISQNVVGVFAVSAGDNGASAVTIYGPEGFLYSLPPFPDPPPGGLRVATADFNGDGTPDVAVGTGPGVSTQVIVYDGITRQEIFSFAPFEAGFTGGLFLAAGDVNGDGHADLAVTPDEGGGPRVRLFSGDGFGQIADFFGIEDPSFRGGARSAFADIDGDGRADLLVAAGFGGGPRLAAFAGDAVASGSEAPQKLFPDFFVFEQTLRDGVFIAGGDVDGDGFADIIAGGGPGGGPRVFGLSGKLLVESKGTDRVQVANFFAGDPANRGGIRVVAKDLDGDAFTDLVTGAGTDAIPRLNGYSGREITPNGTPPELFGFEAFGSDFLGGVFVG